MNKATPLIINYVPIKKFQSGVNHPSDNKKIPNYVERHSCIVNACIRQKPYLGR